MPNVLIVSNCPSPNTRRLQQAVKQGCQNEELINIKIRCKEPWEADHRDVLWSDGVILGTTENFGYMSGAIKDFFERIYYPCLTETEGKPVALFIKGGLDGQGAKISVERILLGLKWKLIQPPLVLKGDFCDEFVIQCVELGTLMSAGLEVGIY
ncbi:MAG: NAD(P)H-dependent oxidoreductase [Gammaproteobacteria bacterium]|nr:NAD(P)H-dependent oxidoreductase [Gammaproteobacteria bacterium]MCY4219069.1 NAD(P)H-dependent oxidoreductase [Gammaproteobacteria bacterium]MCY4276005.1 NAD(P)H-dependent oxidoreductase [Gammaproteobacteria bacterium]